jgi:DMSO/TMAO reductase YedYZ molybdopterin-dependent catalytic subunit
VTAVPENSETPLEDVRGWVTPNRLFFVRNHFGVPEIDLATWRLRLGGCVERPKDKAHGVQWGAGAIGHAEWTGVPLRILLEEAGLKSETKEIVCTGHDRGSEADHPEPMQFARGLPVEKALDPDTLLAYRMNGELLEPAHGFPLRLIVPGWYGVASVKWLHRIEAATAPFRGYYQTVKYTVQRRTANGQETVVVGPMAIKSEIVRPRVGEVLGVGTNRLFGVAWAGPDAVARIEVSCDGGQSWREADLLGPRAPYSWTLWEYLWEVADAGDYTLLVRAVSAGGQVQPREHEPLLGGYQIHFSRPRLVRVERTRHVRDQHSTADLLVYDMNAFAEENVRHRLDVEMEYSLGGGI